MKFRSWNEELKKFFYFENGRTYKDEECSRKRCNCVSERVCSEFNWENAEQFTGKLDGNNKEIYVNDFIKVFCRKEDSYYKVAFGDFELDDNEYYETQILGYMTTLFVESKGSLGEHESFVDIDTSWYTVIGNIHENKGLENGKI